MFFRVYNKNNAFPGRNPLMLSGGQSQWSLLLYYFRRKKWL